MFRKEKELQVLKKTFKKKYFNKKNQKQTIKIKL